jgi:hypothetical protein
MVNDGGCPFMFDGTLSFDRVLMPASQASTALRPPFHHFVVPLPPRAGGGKFLGTRSPPPCKRGEARFWVNRPSPPCFSCPPPTQGVGGERSETEGGISAMVSDGGCPFMFDGPLSFDRVLMPASAGIDRLEQPPPPLRGPPPPASRGRQGFGNVVPLPPASGGRQGSGLIAPLLHVFLAHPT